MKIAFDPILDITPGFSVVVDLWVRAHREIQGRLS
jgi:hypothetical protein